MVQARQEIPITETWARDTWANFDTGQAITDTKTLGREPDPASFPFALTTQNHIDVRTFVEGSWTGGLTADNLGIISNWPGGTANLTASTATFVSNYTTPIDLTTIGVNTTLRLALPLFPASSINLANSFIDLSSDGFQSICALPWSSASLTTTGTSTPLNTALSWPYSSLTGIDLTHVTGVRFRITATANCTIYLMALRLTDNSWVATNMDFDNLSNQLRPCIPITGDPSVVPPNNQVLPPLWRSAAIPGVDDPHPVDAEVGCLFNTGSQQQTNSFTIYMRGRDEAFITQLDLQGVTQTSLTGLPQPTEGVSTKAPRTMGDLDQIMVSGLDDQPMLNLEAVSNPVYTSWVSFTVAWGLTSLVHISNSAQPNQGYRYNTNLNLVSNTTYLAIFSLVNTTARLQIFSVDQKTFALGPPVFDTTTITDSFRFTRAAGRIGFRSFLRDGDAFLGTIRPRSLTFAEYRSAPFNSLTPVKGARLYARSSPDTSLFTEWTPFYDNQGLAPVLTIDQGRYVTTHSDHVSAQMTVTQPSTTTPAQGVISNILSPMDDPISGITDFDQLHLSFSLWVSSEAMSAPTLMNRPIITAAFISADNNTLTVNLPTLTPDQWNAVEIMRPIATTPYPLSGLYQFVLHYTGTVPTTWWVDGVSIREHAIQWGARSVVDDPWKSNYAPWTYFHDTVNSDTSGVLFTTLGTQLQMNAKARKQNAAILSSPNLVPVYAELGRIAWPEDGLASTGRPIATISGILTTVTRTYAFDGTGSNSPNGPVLDYQWSFGDGTTDSGGVVSHTYPSWVPAGTTYSVELTIVDSIGRSAIATTIITL